MPSDFITFKSKKYIIKVKLDAKTPKGKDNIFMHKDSIFSKLLKEPLLHFLLIGVGLFFLYSQLNNNEEQSDTQQIIIDKSKVEVLSNAFMEENGIAPSQKEIQKLLEKDIREEILYHEAISQGLDKNDRVIRHRLAQKMTYLFEDVSMLDEPSDEVLKAYLQENPEKFVNSAGNVPKYSEIKQHLKREWTAKEQQKENNAFYENLKSRYKIIIKDDVRKELNMSVPN